LFVPTKDALEKKVKVPEISNSAGVKGSPAKASDLVGDANGLLQHACLLLLQLLPQQHLIGVVWMLQNPRTWYSGVNKNHEPNQTLWSQPKKLQWTKPWQRAVATPFEPIHWSIALRWTITSSKGTSV
jgi:hypothetical protein